MSNEEGLHDLTYRIGYRQQGWIGTPGEMSNEEGLGNCRIGQASFVGEKYNFSVPY